MHNKVHLLIKLPGTVTFVMAPKFLLRSETWATPERRAKSERLAVPQVIGKVGQSPYTQAEVFPMPTRNVNLPEKLDQFITAKVESGEYANASEVMRTALRLLERDEREYEEKMAALRAAIDDGLASGIAEPGVFARIRKKYGLPQREA